jgi:hypothetical protein
VRRLQCGVHRSTALYGAAAIDIFRQMARTEGDAKLPARREHDRGKRAVLSGGRRLWSARDIAVLKKMTSGGYTAVEIARKLRRTDSAIYARIQFEGLALTRKNRFSAALPPRYRQRRR